MTKLATIVGARPQFIKASTVSREIRNARAMEEMLIHTGQHFDSNMSKVFFEEMDIQKPDINLGINSESEGVMVGKMVGALDKVFDDYKPDCVIVYGDTTSTLAGALTANKKGLRLAHIESGMRSFDRSMREEINRVLSDHLSDFLFCSTKTAVSNLLKGGVDHEKQKIVLTGDVMFDSFLFYSEKLKEANVKVSEEIIEKGKYILLTLHRQANVDDPETLSKLFESIIPLTEKARVVFPCHPRTRKKLSSIRSTSTIEIVDPVGYFNMLNLLQNCDVVLTDSGGLQKEAYFAKKYCITLRKKTEWVELVENECNVLAGNRLIELSKIYDELSTRDWVDKGELYGQGNAAHLIVSELRKYL